MLVVSTLLFALCAAQTDSPIQLRLLRDLPLDQAWAPVLAEDGGLLAFTTPEGLCWAETRTQAPIQRSAIPGRAFAGRHAREFLVASNGTLSWLEPDLCCLHDIPLHLPHGELPAKVLSIQQLPDRRSLLLQVSTAKNRADLMRWTPDDNQVETWPPITAWRHYRPEQIGWSSDGTQVATSGRFASSRAGVRLRGKALDVHRRPGQTILSCPSSGIAITDDGTQIYRSHLDFVTTVDVATGETVERAKGRMTFLAKVHGDRLLTHDNLTLYLWETRPLRPVARWPWEEETPAWRQTRPKSVRIHHGAVQPAREPEGVPPHDWKTMRIGAVVISGNQRCVAIQDVHSRRIAVFEFVRPGPGPRTHTFRLQRTPPQPMDR